MIKTVNVVSSSTEWQEMIDRVVSASAEYVEIMAAAYLKETNLPASEVELVQQMDGYKIRWYFQKRES